MPTQQQIPPRTILLATDLTSGSDRARDRVVQLVREWHATVHVVHALAASPPAVPAGVDPATWRGRHDFAAQEAMRLLRRDMLAGDLDAQLHIEQGIAPAQAILAVAERVACDLVVLGAQRERFAPLAGSTPEQVMRSSPASVLVVRDRPVAPYRHLLVGTDFTDEAQQALEFAARLCPTATIALLHATEMPYGSMFDSKPDTREHWVAGQLAELRRHLAAADLAEERRAVVHVAVEEGPPGVALARWVRDQGADLTVIGAHPRGALYDTFVGTTRGIVEAAPGDLLLVRAVRRS